MYVSALVSFITCLFFLNQIIDSSAEVLPTYCIDEGALRIFGRRFQCMRGGAVNELALLRKEDASEYARAHELVAHLFFVETPNPYRRSDCKDAELEYIPLLPLHWLVGKPGIPSENCSYAALISDILEYVAYVKKTRKITNLTKDNSLPRFTVASTYNLRTEMGTGMPTQVRRGFAWDTVSEFVMSVSIGHYERWPQCPDLLRKSWKHMIELPYVPLTSFYWSKPDPNFGIGSYDAHTKTSISLPHGVTLYDGTPSKPEQTIIRFDRRAKGMRNHRKSGSGSPLMDAIKSSFESGDGRDVYFLFTGRMLFQAPTPENICSVRQAVSRIREECLPPIMIYNITAADSKKGVKDKLVSLMKRSIFCVITKADSYSTSTFYTAMHAGCIPIVISDWFSFAFPHTIPYDKFVIRIDEESFLKCATCTLQEVLSRYRKHDVEIMRKSMFRWIGLLSYEHVPTDTLYEGYLHSLYPIQEKFINTSSHSPLLPPAANVIPSIPPASLGGGSVMTIFPFELLMLEVRYRHFPEAYNTVFHVCETPYHCSYGNKAPQVQPLPLKNLIPDERSHLCKHAGRLIGYYKIVYFMQCVRILWPLSPGKLIKMDKPLLTTTVTSLENNVTWVKRVCYKPDADNKILASPTTGLLQDELSIVSAFHKLPGSNLTLPSDFIYPTPRSHIPVLDSLKD